MIDSQRDSSLGSSLGRVKSGLKAGDPEPREPFDGREDRGSGAEVRRKSFCSSLQGLSTAVHLDGI
jgi:hypothetical protein